MSISSSVGAFTPSKGTTKISEKKAEKNEKERVVMSVKNEKQSENSPSTHIRKRQPSPVCFAPEFDGLNCFETLVSH
ncbi:hypothetical protein AAC387_Pa01g3425 [Persea americana]